MAPYLGKILLIMGKIRYHNRKGIHLILTPTQFASQTSLVVNSEAGEATGLTDLHARWWILGEFMPHINTRTGEYIFSFFRLWAGYNDSHLHGFLEDYARLSSQ